MRRRTISPWEPKATVPFVKIEEAEKKNLSARKPSVDPGIHLLYLVLPTQDTLLISNIGAWIEPDGGRLTWCVTGAGDRRVGRLELLG